MAEQMRLSFEECARQSGLLSDEQIAELAEAVRTRSGGQLPADPRVRGELLGEEAVARGLLNAWQVKQLLDGRVKFTLGPYRVVDGLGRGGTGHIFKGVHEFLGREVAIKVLPRDRASPERVERFLQEIRTLAALDHPNLVRALDAGRDGGVYYLVLEYVPGLDLRRYVQASGPLPETEAATIIAQVALGLEYAHRRGLIHRDVKPGNVLVSPEGRAKLSDLGFASSLFGDELLGTRQAKIAGTVDYLAPDHITAPWDPKPAWDIYSLGCTLYYAVTGRVPFPEGSTEEKMRAHLEKRPVDPRELNPKLSPELCELITQMMAKDPQERPASALEVVLRLGPWVNPAMLPGEYALAVHARKQAQAAVSLTWPSREIASQSATAEASRPAASGAAGTGDDRGLSWPSESEQTKAPILKSGRPSYDGSWQPRPDGPEEGGNQETGPSPAGILGALILFVLLPVALIAFALVLAHISR
ncbi:MAG: serine/threonine protein kinase [Thermoguttaceae bacterium]|nr:serine/threonine protein kinase [Thermoguttaceae bacterium]MDW8078345.1 serine/threonine-protein kinase [Thermoguttaceae bacterium]